MRWARTESGQSSVELVALLPLALIVGLAILSLLAARSTAGQAAAAAHAGGDVAAGAGRWRVARSS